MMRIRKGSNFSLLGQREPDQHPRTALRGLLDDAASAQLGRPFAHRGEADARATSRGDADAVVN